MSDKSLFDVDDVVRAIDQVHNVLGGWYDNQKKEWHEGIDTKLDNIDHTLERELTGISRELSGIDRKLDDISKQVPDRLDNILEALNEVSLRVAGVDNSQSTRGGIGSLMVFLCASAIAILGTLRHWF